MDGSGRVALLPLLLSGRSFAHAQLMGTLQVPRVPVHSGAQSAAAIGCYVRLINCNRPRRKFDANQTLI